MCQGDAIEGLMDFLGIIEHQVVLVLCQFSQIHLLVYPGLSPGRRPVYGHSDGSSAW